MTLPYMGLSLGIFRLVVNKGESSCNWLCYRCAVVMLKCMCYTQYMIKCLKIWNSLHAFVSIMTLYVFKRKEISVLWSGFYPWVVWTLVCVMTAVNTGIKPWTTRWILMNTCNLSTSHKTFYYVLQLTHIF